MNRIKIYSFLILCFAIIGISKAQNVGVGTTTPQNKFHVNGQIRVDTLISGTLTADSVVLVGTNGVFKKVQFNAMPDQALGSIDIFPFAAIPSDYIECNGQAVSRTTYSGLFAKIGTTYGAGNGSTTFNVPDLRGEFVRGWDNGRGVDNSRTLGSWQKGTVIAADKAADFSNDRIICLSVVGSSSDASSLGFIGADAIGGATYIGSQVLQTDLNGPVIQEPTSSLMSNAVAGVTRPRNVAMVYAIKAKESVMIPTSTYSAIETAATAYEPWYSTTTNTGATSNTENIYQMGSLGVGTTTPNASAILDLSSTSKGIAIPRMTSAQRKAIASPTIGLQVYDTDLKGIYVFDGTWDCLNVPAGTVQYAARNTPPRGYLEANGQAVSRTTYAELFAAIGTAYGTGNGSTTFNVPDLRGEFIRGWDNGRGADAGRTIGSFQPGSAQWIQNADASPVLFYGNAAGLPSYGCDSYTSSCGYPSTIPGIVVNAASYNSITITTASTPSSSGDYLGITRPRNIALMPLIKF
jgi:microcystin-dependent protein